MSAFDVLVVGAGFAGAVMAERSAARGLRVLVIDRRSHIAGNAYDERDEHGVLIHRYGPHIFHTNAEKVFDYLSRFTDWRPYEHRVLADVEGRHVPMPINRSTLNALYGAGLRDEASAQAFLDARAEPRARVETSEDAVVAKVGRELYETLFRGYTRKQWGLDPSQLHAQVCARIPVRVNDDDRYFGDTFQYMPADGYTALFERLLDHPRIEVRCGVEFASVDDSYDHLVWTGPIDEYFGHCFGALPYRSLRFETASHDTPGGALVQPVAVINHPAESVPYTRVTEYRHLTGQVADVSTLHYEYPSAVGDPYYPVPRPENRALYNRYAALAAREKGITFVGRLARYQYLNMDQVVAQALAASAALSSLTRV
ncbi:UDP-galactopyranose mutase [Solirubrobacter soli]|uniref:UDP-galactopyranose mutase n=1 Tax=Solirubrobacter soli TaxID=363832 RepID=UPI0004077FB9|nr:UDP-galactopyranose mutase [Solirubrobacter soli]